MAGPVGLFFRKMRPVHCATSRSSKIQRSPCRPAWAHQILCTVLCTLYYVHTTEYCVPCIRYSAKAVDNFSHPTRGSGNWSDRDVFANFLGLRVAAWPTVLQETIVLHQHTNSSGLAGICSLDAHQIQFSLTSTSRPDSTSNLLWLDFEVKAAVSIPDAVEGSTNFLSGPIRVRLSVSFRCRSCSGCFMSPSFTGPFNAQTQGEFNYSPPGQGEAMSVRPSRFTVISVSPCSPVPTTWQRPTDSGH